MVVADPSSLRAPAAPDWPEQLAVRVSRCYWELGMTQSEIAASLGIGRARVIALLAEARRRGIVTITIASPLLENVELGDALVERYGLRFAEVCLSRADDEHTLARQVSAAAGPPVARRLADGMTVGIGWGITLRGFADQLAVRPMADVSVVALLGSLTRRSSMDRYEATTALAARLDAECLYLPSPIVCDSARARRTIVAQPTFRDIERRALGADLAIVSIGGPDSATIRAVGLVTATELKAVRAAGAIGNFLGHYIDADGDVLDCALNGRIIGIPGPAFSRVPERIMISAGANEVRALRAVLARGFVNALVTDQATARALLR